METTGDLFGERPEAAIRGERGLVIGASSKAPLTKAQQAFNRLIKKIENLRQSIEQETERMNRHLGLYSVEIHPLEVKILEQRKRVVRRLYPFLDCREIPGRKQRQVLREVLLTHLTQIAAEEGDLQDEDLIAIRDAITESMPLRPPDKDEDKEFLEELKERAAADFKDMGVDVDLSKFRPDMSPEELFEMLAEMEAQVKAGQTSEGQGQGQKSGKESKAAARARMEDELRQRDLGSLYKQLAKMLHPDLEADPTLRTEKEAAMKDLTTAYKRKDLHAILRLELEWISREQADVSRLTEEKLRAYNGILREQVNELETRLFEVPHHPRFSPLQRFTHSLFGTRHFNPVVVRQDLNEQLKALRFAVQALEGPRALEEVREMIVSIRRDSSRYPDPLF
ncbi:MAG: hypothetical protein RIS76_252 [Verrucomicrobiota bacterium]|jgi:hypothetical protein